jgi:hypothetical protein
MPKPRKTPEQRLAELQAKRDAITARMDREKAKLRTDERKRDTRRKIVAGAIVLEHARHDPGFGAALDELLRQHVTRPEDRELFGFDAGPPGETEAATAPQAFDQVRQG